MVVTTQVDQNREDEDGRISPDTATPTALTNQADNLLDTVIRQAIMQAFTYSKMQFATAKDGNDIIRIADENAKMLLHIVQYKLEGRVEEMLAERIEQSLYDGGPVHVRVGNKLYQVTDLGKVDPDDK